jgi:4-hydroxy-tetrahydrodipicolinate synthase
MPVTLFGQVVTAMVTPFTQDGQVDYAVAEQLADHLVAHGSDGLLLCGTTGESPTLTWDEEYKLFQVVKQAIAGRAKILAGTGSNSTREAIEATRKAATLGLDGALLVVPYYNKPPQEGLYEHFKAIATAVPDLPIMLYNVPGRTGQTLLPETVARLAELPNVVSLKDAGGNLDHTSQVRRLVSSNFEIYSGDDSLTLPMLAIGAVGVVSVASHIAGDLLKQMVGAFFQGQPQVATEIHIRLIPLFKALFATTSPIPVKSALRLQGWSVGSTRLPLSAVPLEIEAELKTVLTHLSLL